MIHRDATSLALCAFFAWVAFLPRASAEPFQSLALSADTTLELESLALDHHQVAATLVPGSSVGLVDLGPLPSSVDLDAYHRVSDTEHLFSLDSAVQLPGPIEVLAGDIVRYDGSSYFIELDSRSAGLENVNVDAVTLSGSGDLILSVDTSIAIGPSTAHDEDLLRWDGSSLSILLPLSLVQVPDKVDLDAMHRDAERDLWYFSFDTTWQIDGKVFEDEDILRLDILNSIWQAEPRGEAESPAWAEADLDALHLIPDPSLIFADGFESGSTFYWSR